MMAQHLLLGHPSSRWLLAGKEVFRSHKGLDRWETGAGIPYKGEFGGNVADFSDWSIVVYRLKLVCLRGR